MSARKTKIEFLPQEDWEKGTWGRILKWALTIGRHIVIFTELIVILAFLSRFKLDKDLTDLGEEIKQKQAIIQASTQFEKKFRFLNKKIKVIKDLKMSRLQSGPILEEIATLIPIDVYLSNFSVSGKDVVLDAIAFSEGGLATFLKNLKESSRFKGLTLSQIALGPETEAEIKVQLRGKIGGI